MVRLSLGWTISEMVHRNSRLENENNEMKRNADIGAEWM